MFCPFFFKNIKILEPGNPGKIREMAEKNREISWVLDLKDFERF